MVGPAPFLGIGTGRCGTMSLASIVNSCDDASCAHEGFLCHWYEVTPQYEKLVPFLKEGRERGELMGNVAAHQLPHLEMVRKEIPDLKVVCLHREKGQVVNSFLRRTSQSSLLRPCDTAEIDDVYAWCKMMPTIDAATPKQAWEFYWEMYEEWASRLPQPIYHIRTIDLNENRELENLFEFLEIPEDNRNYYSPRILNTWRSNLREHLALTW